MKLKNKKTGEIKDVESLGHEKSLRDKYGPQITLSWNTEYENLGECKTYNSLAELNADWEDYEEPKSGIKDVWFPDIIEGRNNVVISFETREEAELAVRKLKAWKRLKDKGFRFTGYTHKDRGRLDELEIYCQLGECPENIEEMDDVHLLFGGEE